MDLGAVVVSSMRLIRSSTPANITIEQEYSNERAPILVNDTQINQLLINLCNNSIDALPVTGGVIKIFLEKETIKSDKLNLKRDLKPGRYVKLLVSDNGSGMDKTVLERMFEPYFTTKGLGKGTGLGLAVVHGIVENHNGRIFADSRPGEGTTITVYFPEQPVNTSEVVFKDHVPPTGRECILYIDDEESLAKLGKRHLDSLGYKTESVTVPETALNMIQSNPHKFDLVITDMAMPNMTGDQLIQAIKKICPEMPTIICTGYSPRMSEEKADDLGVNAFVMKPLNKTELAKIVRKVLDRRTQKV
jgi:CheY-like chemotaxis protein